MLPGRKVRGAPTVAFARVDAMGARSIPCARVRSETSSWGALNPSVPNSVQPRSRFEISESTRPRSAREHDRAEARGTHPCDDARRSSAKADRSSSERDGSRASSCEDLFERGGSTMRLGDVGSRTSSSRTSRVATARARRRDVRGARTPARRARASRRLHAWRRWSSAARRERLGFWPFA